MDQTRTPQPLAPSWKDLLAEGRGVRIGSVLLVIILHAGGNYAVITLAPAIIVEIGGGVLVGALTALFNITTILAAASVGPLAGRLGTGPVLWIMACACGLGALLSASAGTMVIVAIGRAVAGFGGGGLLALAFVALRADTTATAFPKISALSGAFWIGAAFAGPLIGGVLADNIGWRMAFIFMGGASVLYAILNHRTISRVTAQQSDGRFPWLAFAALGAGIGCISFAPLLGFELSLILSAVGIAALAAAVWRERSGAPRMFPINAFRVDTVQGGAIAAKTVLGISSMSVLVFGPLLLSIVHGRSATFAGGFILIETMAWSAASFLIVSIPRGRKIAGLGPLVTFAGLVGCTVYLVSGQLFGAAVSIMACGAGLGMVWPFLGERIVAGDVGGEQTKTMAMVSSIETLGFAIGGAVMGLVGSLAAGGAFDTPELVANAATAGIILSMPFALIGTFLALRTLGN